MHVLRLVATSALFSIFFAQSQACLGGFGHQFAPRSTDGNVTQETEFRLVPRPPKTRTALVNVRVFDGYAVQPASTVYFEGEYLTSDAGNVHTIIDGQGAILLPGLIDSHSHPAKIADLEQFSAYGVTTVLAMACNNYATCSALHDQVGLTSYLSAGIPVIAPNTSHAAVSPNPQTFLTSPSQAADYTAWVFGNGSDWMKVIAEENGPSQDLQNSIVLHSHAVGRQVMTHAALLEYYAQAIKSKADGLQHMPYDELLGDELLEQMVLQRQTVTPTMYLYRNVLPHIQRLDPLSPAVNATSAFGIVQQNVKKCREHGIPVLAGTDSFQGAEYGFFLPFGVSLHEELFNLVQVGFSEADAIRAATEVPALFHRLDDRGRIAPGHRADLLLLTPDADPMKNINDTLKIARVWNAGIEYHRVYNATT